MVCSGCQVEAILTSSMKFKVPLVGVDVRVAGREHSVSTKLLSIKSLVGCSQIGLQLTEGVGMSWPI